MSHSLKGEVPPEHVLFGCSAVMQKLRENLSRFCNASVPIVLQGEVGVGKSTLARFVHQRWFATRGQYARLTCSSVDKGWAALAFCAVLKGSQVPAIPSSDVARPVTLFLDEVNELPGKLQQLLAALMIENSEQHDGCCGPVCIIGSSTSDLRREMKEGHFRRDLLQQLAVGILDVPPLRERKEDLPEICEYMRRRCCERTNVADRPFQPDQMERMMAYDWPGNLNELESYIGRFVALGPEHCKLAKHSAAVADRGGENWLM